MHNYIIVFTFDLGLQHRGVVDAEHIHGLGLARRDAVLVHTHHHVLTSINACLRNRKKKNVERNYSVLQSGPDNSSKGKKSHLCEEEVPTVVH